MSLSFFSTLLYFVVIYIYALCSCSHELEYTFSTGMYARVFVVQQLD